MTMHWKKIRALSFLEAPVLLTIFLVGVIHTIRMSNWQRAQLGPQTTVPAIGGLIEAERMEIKGKSSVFGSSLQGTSGFKGTWSLGGQLFVQFPSEGSYLDFVLPPEPKGEFIITVHLTRSYDYGIVQFYVDEKKIGPPIDLWSQNEVQATGPILLGTLKFKAAPSSMRVKVVGRNPRNVAPHYYFGIDGIILTKKQL